MTISQKIKMALAYKGMSEAELAFCWKQPTGF